MSEINRQLSTNAAISNRNQLANKSLRKARTRTLIQAGSLLSMTGFFTICGIEEGQNLQLDFENGDKAAILLGVLSEAFEKLPVEPSTEQFSYWKNIGIRILKMRKSNTANS